jgi:Uma2 family endonuclease
MPAEQETARPSPQADPFPYGWRPRYVRQPSGEVVEQRIPLTPEDLLNPQLGDVVVQGGKHFWEVHRVAGLLDRHFTSRKDVYVAGDMKMLWGIPGLAEPAPDVAVIFGVRDKDAERASFNCVLEGTRPSLIIEVVSSKDEEVRRNDYEKKVDLYEEVGIPEYLLVAPPPLAKNRPLLLTGYRLDSGGRFQPIRPDGEGFLFSETTKLRFGVAEDGRTIRVQDVISGKWLLTASELEAHAQATEAENARLRAEIERLKREHGQD